MNKKESKYFSTAVKMDTALIELLEKKDFEYITVKEVCEKAGVNRSTFYLHYDNTTDILREATRNVVDRFLIYFKDNGEKFSIDFENCTLDELIFMESKYLVPYLTYIKENRRVFRTALNQFSTMGFEAYYDRMFRYIFDPILVRFKVPCHNRQYVIKFYLTGMTAIAVEWLGNGCKDPIENICEIIIQCTTRDYGTNKI